MSPCLLESNPSLAMLPSKAALGSGRTLRAFCINQCDGRVPVISSDDHVSVAGSPTMMRLFSRVHKFRKVAAKFQRLSHAPTSGRHPVRERPPSPAYEVDIAA
jgi:hypothetical protein